MSFPFSLLTFDQYAPYRPYKIVSQPQSVWERSFRQNLPIVLGNEKYAILPAMNARRHATVLLALPLAYQDGRDWYAGFLRYVSEHRPPWNVRLERERLTPGRARQIMKDGVDAAVLDNACTAPVLRALAAVPVCVATNVFDRRPFVQRRVAFVDTDSAALGRYAAEHFLGRTGGRSQAFVGYPSAIRWSKLRQDAFRARLAEAGRAPRELTLPYGGEQTATARRTLGKFLRELPHPADVFAVCDQLARHIAEAANEEGLSVPDDVAVLGVDNEEIVCTHVRPTLSSMQPDFKALGYEAARILDEMLTTGRQPCAERIVGGIRLVQRESTAPSYSTAFLVAQVKDVVRNWEDGCPHVGEIAGALGVSRRLVDLRFREITGETVLDFIRRERVERIKKLLAETDMPITDICEACAFRSANQVKRIFRTIAGTSMSDWRKTHR